MRYSYRFGLLTAVMAAVAAFATVCCIVLLYRADLAEDRAHLTAWVLENKAEILALHAQSVSPEQIIRSRTEVQRKLAGVAQSTECVVGKRDGDEIVFLLDWREGGTIRRVRVPFDGVAAEPMRRALRGETGTVQALDYRDVEVLAGYAPVPELGWGVVVKVDMAEIRAPFVRAGLLAAAVTAVAALFGALLFTWLLRPVVRTLEEGRRRFRAVFDATHQTCMLVRPDGAIVDFSVTSEQFSGETRDAVVGRCVWDTRPWRDFSEAQAKLHALVSRAGRGEPAHDEIALCMGEDFPAILNVAVKRLDASDAASLLLIEGQDVTAERRAEEDLRRVNRMLQTLSDCNQTLVRADREAGLLDAVCKVVHTVGRHAFVWVGYVQDDAARSVMPVAQAGRAEGYLDAVRVAAAEVSEHDGVPAGAAIRTGMLQLTADIELSAESAPWRGEALKRGFRSVIALPLMHDKTILGALEIYATDRDAFAPAEVRLLEELAGDLAYGIQSLRTRSAHERALLSLAESEEKFRTLFEHSADGMFLMDGAVFVDCNAQACTLWACSRGEIIGHGPAEFSPAEQPGGEASSAKAARLVLAALAGTPQFFAWRHIRRDGRSMDAEVALHAVTVGGRLLLQATMRDVTEFNRAAQYLHESEARFQSAFDHAAIGMSLVGLDGHYIQVNQSFCNMLGRSEAELVGRHFAEVTHPDDVADGLGNLRSLADGDLPSGRLRKRYFHKDGSIVWAQVSAALVRDHEKAPLYVVSQVQDISEQKRAEDELQRAQALLSGVLNSALDAVIAGRAVRDSRGKIVDFECLLANAAVERLTGRSTTQLVGQRMRKSMAVPLLEDLFNQCVETVTSGVPIDREHRTEQGGRTRWVRVATAKLGDGIAATFSDITESKQLQEQFLQAQKMEAVGRLAGGVAHDFNNILTVIVGTVESISLSGLDEAAVQEGLQEIQSAAERAATLTGQLLTFSRRQVESSEVICVNDVLRHSERMLQRLIGEDIDLAAHYASDLWAVRADRHHIEQIILNLAVNSRDAIHGAGKLTIETANVVLDGAYAAEHIDVTPGEYVLLTVTDTGCGMSPEVLSRVFEPFFTTKAPGEGTGLGLATVYGIVKQSGGRVRVYSEEGIGTTVRVYWPKSERVAEIVGHDEVRPEARGGSETVLLVEDDEMVRNLTRRILEKEGYRLIEAALPAEALSLAAKEEDCVALVLSDVIMPGMSGPELAQRLAEFWPETRFLYMSGYTDLGANRRGLIEPDTPFLQKPFTRENLLRKVREVLDA